VVYEYANRLAVRGHGVTVVHPRRLRYCPAPRPTGYQWARSKVFWMRGLLSRPAIDWQPIDPRVNLSFVATSDRRYIPEGDVIFATAWHTAATVLQYPEGKGVKCYFIQGYAGEKELVDATWHYPLHKVVIARWLKDLGGELGCRDLTYIPNAINHEIFRLTAPIAERPRQVAMAFSREECKGSRDGIAALEIAKKGFPDLKAVFFSASRADSSVPTWVEFHRNPPLQFILDEIYGRSSIFLCPSILEGWGLPAAEASACGCAVVSTDNGGVREYLKDGATGLLSPPGDPMKLAENLNTLLRNDSLRVQLAKQGNSFVSRLSWERSADRMEDFIKNVTKRRRALLTTSGLALEKKSLHV